MPAKTASNVSKQQIKKSTKSATIGQIRIIGGQWRGRKLPVPDSEGLRPTTDPIRETLFNWLAPILRDAHCLDCFAGSGALGFEALSRYASTLVLLEYDRKVAQQLEKNRLLLKTENAQVFNVNSLNWLKQPTAEFKQKLPFDVVFLDPPFRCDLLDNTVTLLENNGWLADESWIYVEAEIEKSAPAMPTRWHLHREKIAGQVAYRLYHRQK